MFYWQVFLSVGLLILSLTSAKQISPLTAPRFARTPSLWRLYSPGAPTVNLQEPIPATSEVKPRYIDPRQDDMEESASGYGHHHGRVHIKVFRGPDDHHFAPHGYWVKQPADDGRNYRR